MGLPPQPLPPIPDLVALAAEEKGVDRRDICVVDLGVIQTMAFKGTGVCSENCRKVRAGEPVKQYRAVAP